MKYKLKLDYTEDELQELRKIGMVYDGPIAAVYQLGETEVRNDPYRNLRRKYRILDIHKEFDLMADINNVVMGTADFPGKKYCLQQVFDDWVKKREIGMISESKAHEIVGSMLDLYHPKIQIVTKASKKIMTIEADINDCKVEK